MSARAIAGIVMAVVVVSGLYVLRATTMSREKAPPDPGARLVVDFSVTTKDLPAHELPVIASAIFNACRLQAEAGLQQPLDRLGRDRFRAVLTPAPNATDREQLAGCLSDPTLSHTLSGDVRMREIPSPREARSTQGEPFGASAR